MLKKIAASFVTAAFVIAGPGHLTLDAAAQVINRPAAVNLNPGLTGVGSSPITGLGSMPVLAPIGAATLNSPLSAASASSLTPAPVAAVIVPGAAKALPVQAVATSARALPVSAAAAVAAAPILNDAKAPQAEKAAALNRLFDASSRTGYETIEVLGQSAASESRLEKSVPTTAKTAASVPSKNQSGSSVAGVVGIAALVGWAAAMIFSPSFRALMARLWNSTIGALGRLIKRTETPENMAQRIVDELKRQEPIYNQKVAKAVELAAGLRRQVKDTEKQIAELDESARAILSDSDEKNDDMAIGLINSKNALVASNETNKTQLTLAEKAVEEIKVERAQFFQDRNETLAKVQGGLSRAKAAELRIEIEKLKGGYSTGDLKDSMDKFEQAVGETEDKAEGMKDSSATNPDEVLKKAKDAYRNQKAKDELEKMKKEIEEAKKNKGFSGASSDDGAGVLIVLGLLMMAIALLV